MKDRNDKVQKDGGFENVFYEKLLSYSIGYQNFSVDQFTSDIRPKVQEKLEIEKLREDYAKTNDATSLHSYLFSS